MLLKTKETTNNSSKAIPIDQLIMFPLSPQSYEIAHLKSARFALLRKCFLSDLLRQTNDEKKTGRVWLLQMKLVSIVILPRS